jgi:DNA (cytosine-5)-methyltransferase 1
MEQYAQVGNAVPTRLGLVAGAVIATELDKLNGQKWKPYPDTPEAYRIVYVQSHVRTSQWFKGGETFVWEDESDDQPTYAAPKTKRRSKRI